MASQGGSAQGGLASFAGHDGSLPSAARRTVLRPESGSRGRQRRRRVRSVLHLLVRPRQPQRSLRAGGYGRSLPPPGTRKSGDGGGTREASGAQREGRPRYFRRTERRRAAAL